VMSRPQMTARRATGSRTSTSSADLVRFEGTPFGP
jgi:hypothetical protein